MQIQKLHSQNIHTVNHTSPVKEAASIMEKHDVGILPVVENEGRIVGAVTDRDIVVRSISRGHDPDRTPVSDIMTRDLHTCSENETVEKAAERMREHKVRRLLITDEGRAVKGILSLGDLARGVEEGKLVRDTLKEVSMQR